MSHNILFGNYGNETIALLQWAIETHKAKDAFIVSIDTGWAAEGWLQRVSQAEDYAAQHGITPIRLRAPASFATLVRDRKTFPSKKFQWCAGMLKGITFNAWLDEIDPLGEAIIMLGKWQQAVLFATEITEFIEQSEYYQQRKVWHPLIHHSLAQRNELIMRAGFTVLEHRSLECDPCIHSSRADLARFAPKDIAKTAELEGEINQTMFPTFAENGYNDIVQLTAQARNQIAHEPSLSYQESFAMGCGVPWGCGE